MSFICYYLYRFLNSNKCQTGVNLKEFYLENHITCKKKRIILFLNLYELSPNPMHDQNAPPIIGELQECLQKDDTLSPVHLGQGY